MPTYVGLGIWGRDMRGKVSGERHLGERDLGRGIWGIDIMGEVSGERHLGKHLWDIWELFWIIGGASDVIWEACRSIWEIWVHLGGI